MCRSGTGTLQEELPRLIPWLKQPDVHLAIDPEFSMKRGGVPGTKVGTFDAKPTSTTRRSPRRSRDERAHPAQSVHRAPLDARHADRLQAHQARPARADRHQHGRVGTAVAASANRTAPTSGNTRSNTRALNFSITTIRKRGDRLMSPADVLALTSEADLHPVSVRRCRTGRQMMQLRRGFRAERKPLCVPALYYRVQSAKVTSGSFRTGKFTEFAI